jgi:hypothetical protein
MSLIVQKTSYSVGAANKKAQLTHNNYPINKISRFYFRLSRSLRSRASVQMPIPWSAYAYLSFGPVHRGITTTEGSSLMNNRNANFLLWEFINDVRQGVFSRCKTAGLTTDDIRLLSQLQLDDVTYISNSRVSVVSYRIDPQLLRVLIQQAREARARKTLAERAVSLGASARMMAYFFGWTGRDVARYRELKPDNVFSRGRPPIPSESTSREVIQKIRVAGINSTTQDDEVLEIVMDIAQQVAIPLCSVWLVIDETLDVIETSPLARNEECWDRLARFDFRDKDEQQPPSNLHLSSLPPAENKEGK